MIRSILAFAALTLSLALPGTAGLAQNADTPPSEEELNFVRQKYGVAVWSLRFANKPCDSLSKVQYEAASWAFDHYAKVLDAADLSEQRFAFNQQTFATINSKSCAELLQTDLLRSNLNNVGLLVGEFLLAVHHANIESCGVVGAEDWALLKDFASRMHPQIAARADFPYIDKDARKHGFTIATICSSPSYNSSAETLFATTFGPVLREAVEAVKAQQSAN